MDEQQEQEARWRESLELLGLSPDTPMPGRQETPARPEPSRHEPPAPLPPVAPPLDVQAEEFSDTGDVIEEFLPDSEADLPAVDEMSDEPTSEQELPADATEEGAAPATDEDKPRRGRRRRRRGRRRGGDKAEREGEAPVAETEKAPRSEERPPAGRPPRGDDRRRGRDEPAPTKAAEAESWEDEAPSEEVEDSETPTWTMLETDEIDVLADWDVPAWQDLINSLYRP